MVKGEVAGSKGRSRSKGRSHGQGEVAAQEDGLCKKTKRVVWTRGVVVVSLQDHPEVLDKGEGPNGREGLDRREVQTEREIQTKGRSRPRGSPNERKV